MTDGAYRGEIEAAHARIRQLEEELAVHRGGPAARLAELRRQRAAIAALASPKLTRREMAVSNTVFLVFASAAFCFVLLMFWLWALLAALLAIGVRGVLAKVAAKRAARHAPELAAIELQLAALEREMGDGAAQLPAATPS